MANINKSQARDELKKLYGLPPYDRPGNICQGDGYFSASLRSKYGMSLEELGRLVGVQPPR